MNIEENAPVRAVLKFNKTFTNPPGTSVKDFVVLSTVPATDTSGFGLTVKKRASKKRVLADGETIVEETPTYDMDI